MSLIIYIYIYKLDTRLENWYTRKPTATEGFEGLSSDITTNYITTEVIVLANEVKTRGSRKGLRALSAELSIQIAQKLLAHLKPMTVP